MTSWAWTTGAVPRVAVLVFGSVVGIVSPATARPFLDYWLTPDQQGQRLEAAGDHAAAAARYTDPLRRGVALYRAGDFEAAADAFARVDTPDGAFNRGNALVLLGRYDEAIVSYDRALQLRDGWPEAAADRELARLRKERRDARSDEDQGTRGKLEADDYVFDETGRSGDESDEVQDESGGSSASELEALWMHRLQSRPADFLRAKFAYQLATSGEKARK